MNRSPQQSNPPTLTPQQQNNTKQHNEINPATIKNQTDKVDSKLKILQININGISNKIKELELLIHDTKADIITIQETKLTSNSKTPKINNYTEIRKERTYNKGGGLLTYIKNNITFTNDKIPQNINQKLIEIQLVTIHLTPTKKFEIANIYIPPSNTTNQNLTNEDNDITQCLNHTMPQSHYLNTKLHTYRRHKCTLNPLEFKQKRPPRKHHCRHTTEFKSDNSKH